MDVDGIERSTPRSWRRCPSYIVLYIANAHQSRQWCVLARVCLKGKVRRAGALEVVFLFLLRLGSHHEPLLPVSSAGRVSSLYKILYRSTVRHVSFVSFLVTERAKIKKDDLLPR